MPEWIGKGRPVATPKNAAACVTALKEGKVQAEACQPN
jgi:hypothetical protein